MVKLRAARHVRYTHMHTHAHSHTHTHTQAGLMQTHLFGSKDIADGRKRVGKDDAKEYKVSGHTT